MITVIDGRAAADIDGNEFKALLRRSGEGVAFSVKRGEERLTRPVKLRRIV